MVTNPLSMRKIIFAQLTSIDGYIEDQNGEISWTAPGEELHRHFNALEKGLDINFYGGKMSQAMDFWLTADQNPGSKEYEREYTRLWQETERIVYSKTQDTVKGKAKVLREVDPEEIRHLKKQPGNNMSVGGPSLASTFIEHNLIEEYRLYIRPIVLDGGKPMFKIKDQIKLHFVENEYFSDGTVMLIYRTVH